MALKLFVDAFLRQSRRKYDRRVQGVRFLWIDLCVSRGLVRVVLGSDFGHKMEPKCVQNVAWGHLGGLGGSPGCPKCLLDDFGVVCVKFALSFLGSFWVMFFCMFFGVSLWRPFLNFLWPRGSEIGAFWEPIGSLF